MENQFINKAHNRWNKMKCKGIIEKIENNKLCVKMLKMGKIIISEKYIVNIANITSDTFKYKVGDKVEICFSGIVTLSLPPQISALKIKKVL